VARTESDTPTEVITPTLPHRTWRDLPPAPPTVEHPEAPTQPTPIVPGERADPAAPTSLPPRRRRRRWLVLVSVFVLLVGAVGVAVALQDDDEPTADAAEADSSTRGNGSEPVQHVAEVLGPSVVQLESDIGVGAGVVVEEGIVLTAAHVVSGTEEVTATSADGTAYNGRVVGRAPEKDLAVVALDAAEDLPAASLSDAPAEVGQQVVAVGSPFGFSQSVSAGVVSALDRELETPTGTLTGLIQTDTAINIGNSGGPLADLDGEVLGIATAIASASGGNDGVGFAVPVTDAAALLDEVREAGGVDAPTAPDDGRGPLGSLDDLLGGGLGGESPFGGENPLDGLLDEDALDQMLQDLEDTFGGLLDDPGAEVPELEELFDQFMSPPPPSGQGEVDESSQDVIELSPVPSSFAEASSRVQTRSDEDGVRREHQLVLDHTDGPVLVLAYEGDGAADAFEETDGDEVELAGNDVVVEDDGTTRRYAWMEADDLLVVIVAPAGVPEDDIELLIDAIEAA